MSSPPKQPQYIVRLKDEVDMEPHIQFFHDTYNQNDITAFKITHKWDREFFNAYVGEFHPEVLDVLREHRDVAYVSENSEIKLSGTITHQKDACWGIARINRNTALSGKATDLTFTYKYDDAEETGKGVEVYIVDSGIYIHHEDFGKRARWGTTIKKSTKEKPVANEDKYGHGTHVAGIVGGKRFGVAKNVSLIAVKITDDQGESNAEDGIKGLEWVLAQYKKAKKPSVVNLSWGTTPWNEACDEIATMLVRAGIHVVTSAGNANQNARNASPASAPLVNTVGATNISDKRWESSSNEGSNWGPCVDFYAPGKDITSCGITKDGKDGKKVKDPKATEMETGTSMAAAHVAGIIATFISLHGNLEPRTMTHVLKLLALKINEVDLLARGALHVEATFTLVSNQGAMQLMSRAIFSKLDGYISKYKSEVSEFQTYLVKCDKKTYGTHKFSVAIVSAYNYIDLMLHHKMDGYKEDDKKGSVEVKFFRVTVSGGSQFVGWETFKYLTLREDDSTSV